MACEQGWTVRYGHPLAPLLDHTDVLTVTPRGAIVCDEKIDVPLDEYGIPLRSEFMKQILGTVAAGYIWTGVHDLHHIAWPGGAYRTIKDVGAAYRGAGVLKVLMQRQLHEFTHILSNPPHMPSVEVMRQFAIEHNQVERLFDTIKVTSYIDNRELGRLPFDEQELLRQQSYERKLEEMLPGEIGIMPDIDHLSQLHVSGARPVLRKICRKQGLSNSRKAKRQFFESSRSGNANESDVNQVAA